MNLILFGLPMSGKSSLGRDLSEKLKIPFYDTDHLLEQTFFQTHGEPLSCRQIFLKEGPAAFRTLEAQAIASLNPISGAVIAVGGGTLMESQNLTFLKNLGLLVYLKADPKTLWQRTKICGIPAYLASHQNPETAFYEMMEERAAHYASIADFVWI